MPRRVGYLWEKVITDANCIQAEIMMSKNKKKNHKAHHIKENAEWYGSLLCKELRKGYKFSTPRETDIQDSYKGKVRHLKIPNLKDQAAMHAWLNIATPYFIKRNYYYNCGSIPNAGQHRAVKKLKKILNKRFPPKWAAVTDIRKFYDTCPHEVVIKGLRRIFKDEKFIDFASKIMASMSSDGIGLAIGYPVSHWFANVALCELDHELRRKFPDVLHIRYADDVILTSYNKRHLKHTFLYYMSKIKRYGMSIKSNWQIFSIRSRGITFLSYRFFHGCTILTKQLMFRISKKIRAFRSYITPHRAQSIMSYLGILKHCEAHKFYTNYVRPFIVPKLCKSIISKWTKKKMEVAV